MKYDNIKYTTFNSEGRHSDSNELKVGDYILEVTASDYVSVRKGDKVIANFSGWFFNDDIKIMTKEIFDGRGMLLKVFYKDTYQGGMFTHEEYSTESLFYDAFTKWSLWFLGKLPACNCCKGEYPKKIEYIKKLINSMEPDYPAMNFGDLTIIGQYEDMQFYKNEYDKSREYIMNRL